MNLRLPLLQPAVLAGLLMLALGSSCNRKNEGAVSLDASTAIPAAVRAEPAQTQRAASEAVPKAASSSNTEPALSQRSFTGNLEAHRSTMIAAKMGGTIEQVHIREGSLVKKGDPIVTVGAEDYRLGVEQAQSGLAMAEKQKKMLEREWNRLKALVEAKAVPSSQFDQLDGQLDVALEGVRAARLGVKRAQNAVRDTVTVAPFDGMISMRLVDEGALAMHMPPTMVAMIEQLDPIDLKATFPESVFSQVSEGDCLSVTLPALGETRYAPISRIIPSVQPMTRSFAAVAEIPNPDHRLLAGMFAELAVVDASHCREPRASATPDESVQP